MRKWLCCFAIVASAIVSVAYEQHYAREKYQAKSQADCILLSVSVEEKHSCAKDTQSRKDYAPWWYVLVAWPEGITTWAIIATGFVIAWQSNETRKAAKGALLNAQAFINAERARILFETEAVLGDDRFRGVATFTIFAVNRGKVPAEIINYGKAEICRTPTNTLPDEPKYQMADPPTVRFLVCGDRHAVAEFQPAMPGNTYRLLMDVPGPPPENFADIHLSIYGEVIYRDGISDQIRHSRYCFEFVRESRVIGGRIQPAGPPQYNKYT